MELERLSEHYPLSCAWTMCFHCKHKQSLWHRIYFKYYQGQQRYSSPEVEISPTFHSALCQWRLMTFPNPNNQCRVSLWWDRISPSCKHSESLWRLRAQAILRKREEEKHNMPPCQIMQETQDKANKAATSVVTELCFRTLCEYKSYFRQTVTPSLWPSSAAGFSNYPPDILLSPKLFFF